jgi:hypothetical protein
VRAPPASAGGSALGSCCGGGVCLGRAAGVSSPPLTRKRSVRSGTAQRGPAHHSPPDLTIFVSLTPTTFSLRDSFPRRFKPSARPFMPKLVQFLQKVLQV